MQPDTPDRYANTGQHIYLRLSRVYFRRTLGIGWERIEAASVPATVPMFPLHEKRKAAYEPELRRLGLLG